MYDIAWEYISWLVLRNAPTALKIVKCKIPSLFERKKKPCFLFELNSVQKHVIFYVNVWSNPEHRFNGITLKLKRVMTLNLKYHLGLSLNKKCFNFPFIFKALIIEIRLWNSYKKVSLKFPLEIFVEYSVLFKNKKKLIFTLLKVLMIVLYKINGNILTYK